MKIGKLARWYRWIEYAAFGRALEKRRFAFLPRLASARRVLIPGEGDGRTLAHLLELAPCARIDVGEVSPEMIALAQRRTHSDRVTFLCRDARTAVWPPGHYDGIVTNFFLDCFGEDDARQLIRQLANALAPDGIWLVGEFAVPETGWRRVHAQCWIQVMYRFFGVTTGLRARSLPPIGRLMREAGMHRVEQEKRRAGLMVSEVWVGDAAACVPKPSAAPQTSL